MADRLEVVRMCAAQVLAHCCDRREDWRLEDDPAALAAFKETAGT